jgi:hypothetical protein
LPVQVFILIFTLTAFLLSALLVLTGLIFLLSGLIAMLTRLAILLILLPILFHLVCHKIPPWVRNTPHSIVY